MKGANTNACNICGWTVLMQAARNGSTEIAEVLLKHGADVNACNVWGETALMEAAQYGHTKVEELLLKYGADVDMKNNDGNTLLCWHMIQKSIGYYAHTAQKNKCMKFITGGRDVLLIVNAERVIISALNPE